MGHKEIGGEEVEWIKVTQHRVQWWGYVSICMNL
jgi:hypothetical protein